MRYATSRGLRPSGPLSERAPADALAAHEREQHLGQARRLAVKAGVTVVKKEDVSHSLVSLKKKRLQRLEARASAAP
jgi:hypothetical protein